MGSGARIEVLGPVRVLCDDVPVRVDGAIPRTLLAALVTRGRWGVTDEEFLVGCWGEAVPSGAPASLRVRISNLRNALAPAGIQVVRHLEGYRLAGSYRSDLDDLDAVLGEGGERSPDVGALAAALRLWRGPAVADVRRVPLGEQIGRDLDRRRSAIVDRHLYALVAAGRAHEAIEAAGDALAHEPLNEERWAALSLALCQVGRTAEALDTLERARRRLRHDAGLAPGPVLRDAERRVLAGDVAPPVGRHDPAPDAIRVPGPLRVLAQRRLHGREAELSRLLDALATVIRTRTTHVVRVRAESGGGKTALLAHLAASAVARGIGVRYLAYTPDAARPGTSLAAPLAATGSDTEVTAGELALLHAGAVEHVRRRLVEGSPGPAAVVLVDDVQWADASTVAALRHLARHPDPVATLVVMGERTGSMRAGVRGIEQFDLAPLGADAVAAWIDDADLGDTDPRALLRMTGGVPWMLAEALEHLRSGSTLEGAAAPLGARLLADRLDRVGGSANRTLEWAALLGHHVDLGALERVSDRPSLDVLDDVDVLVDAGILGYDLEQAALVSFTHALLRSAALASVGTRRREAMHERAFTVLEDLVPAADRLRHGLGALARLPPERLAECAVEAVRADEARADFVDAQERIATALAAVGDVHRGSATAHVQAVARLHLAAVRSGLALGDTAHARFHERSLAELAGWADLAVQVDAMRARDLFGHAMAPDEELGTLLARLADVEAGHPDRPYVLQRLAHEHLQHGRTDAARRLIAELAEVEGDDERLILARCVLEHWLAETVGDVATRRAAWGRAASVSDRSPSPVLANRAAGMALIEALHRGDLPAAERAIETRTRHAALMGDPHAVWLAQVARYTPALLRGDVDAAVTAADAAASIARDHQLAEGADAHAAQVFVADWLRCRLDGYAEILEPFVAADPSSFAWSAGLALALASTGRTARAREVLDGIALRADEARSHWLGYVGLAVAVEAADATGHRDLCAAAVPVLSARQGDHVVLGVGVLDLGPVDRYVALATYALGAAKEAIRTMERIAADERSGAIWCGTARRWLAGRSAVGT